MNTNEGKILVVNRSKERKNKFRKKVENGDISSVENYYESCMFGLQGLPRLSYQADSTRTNSLHDLNLSELRDLLLSLMGKKLALPKFFKVGNAPFVRRVIHLHISDYPEAINANTRDSSGGGRALMEALQLGPVKCIRVDKEIDEQGHLPYKLLTVPYSKVADLLPESAEHHPAANTVADAANQQSSTNNVAVASEQPASEEQQAAWALSHYVLSPALLHLWGYTSHHHHTHNITATEHHSVHTTSPDGSSALAEMTREIAIEVMDPPDEHAAKRSKHTHTPEMPAAGSKNNTTIVSGECSTHMPSSQAEAVELLRRMRGSAVAGETADSDAAHGYVTTVDVASTQYAALCGNSSAHYKPVLVTAVDCEMCETEQGSELARVTVLGHDGRVLLETLVKPRNAVLNYLTQYSGITEAMLRDVTVSLEQVQVAVLRIISKDTILVGHSLDSDLRALRVVHGNCVDTAIIYPHPRGFPLRLKLKKLAEDYLQLRIQCSNAKGHDSSEDAKAALQLALLKAANGPLFGVKNPDQQRYPVMGLLDHGTSNAALIWHTLAPVPNVRSLPMLARADIAVDGSNAVVESVADEAAEDNDCVVDDDTEPLPVVHEDSTCTSATVTAAQASVTHVETAAGGQTQSTCALSSSVTTVGAHSASGEVAEHHSAYGPESCAGGNAVTLHSPCGDDVITSICQHVQQHQREARCFEVCTVDDKSAGPVSSWVDKAHIDAHKSADATVEVIKVPQRCFVFGHIAYSEVRCGACGENGEFVSNLRVQIERIRAAVVAADAICSQSPGTLLLVTVQESLQPVLAMIKRKRLLSKATMAAAMWTPAEELLLKDRRKHNLAHMCATII